MSNNYQGRRAPDVSQYIQNLNTIPSAADLAAQQDFGTFVDDDLALFTNTEFIDYDFNGPVPEMPNGLAFDQHNQPGQAVARQDGAKHLGFVNQPNFQYPEFPQFAPQHAPPQALNHVSPHSLPPTPPNGAFNTHPQSQPTVPGLAAFSTLPSPSTGEKRKSGSAGLQSAADLEEQSRFAAEEDKRRRNTAASARFRVKKKQREQALEKSAKEMSDKVATLEARVGQLEMENQWLKGLITEKNMGRMPAMPVMAVAAPAAQNVAADEDTSIVKRDQEDEEDNIEGDDADIGSEGQDERSTEARTKGVGTEGEAIEV